MLCTACKTEIPGNASFCPKCGKRTDEAAPPAATGPAPATGGAAPAYVAARGGPKEPERELWKGSYSPKAMLGWWVLEGILIIAAIAVSIFLPNPITWIGAAGVVIAIGLWVGMALAIRRLSLEYTLTTEQLIHKVGLLRRVTNRIETIDIDDVTFEQTLLERFLGIGSILIISSDQTHPRLMLRGIDEVQRVADLIDNTSREQRRLRGAFVEQV